LEEKMMMKKKLYESNDKDNAKEERQFYLAGAVRPSSLPLVSSPRVAQADQSHTLEFG
jgi:hypothetical protein